ncbi:hypothetical protein ACFFTN_14395 [Aminobacter aganoensis]|uniref:Uncharacterized protein n=1 Tax=Aminobacter aganoensis TaxID=83264 RepID=A0A7X0FA60_9HYPH|nr:hypothetical protein [Aminobacter aganoensis]MBB6355952.1 hypothetical protein [Aminobacter aganoensis]
MLHPLGVSDIDRAAAFYDAVLAQPDAVCDDTTKECLPFAQSHSSLVTELARIGKASSMLENFAPERRPR